jgi:site-specific recombinase XerD
MEDQAVDPYNLTDEQKANWRANSRKWKVKPGPPIITIFVRHSADCKYKGDEFEKRCHCPKHLRWTQERKQHRASAHTRSWSVAENKKREIEDQLAGRTPAPDSTGQSIADAVEIFLADKKLQGVTDNVLGKYTRELDRLRAFCERAGVYTVQGVNRELMTRFCGTWEDLYKSSSTRVRVRERLRNFLRYCYQAEWLTRIIDLPKMKDTELPTMPLTQKEYAKLLDAVYATVAEPARRAQVHALFQLMRWSGLAIGDALRLRRDEILQDKKTGLHRIVTSRQKTGTDVSVPIPPAVANEVLAVLNGNPVYVFWSGNGKPDTISKKWANVYVTPIFEAAGIERNGNMVSHRLRDTFAVDLLQNGVPMEDVSKMLGHESIRTTERSYAKWVKGRQDRLDGLVTATWAKPKKVSRQKGR